MEQRPKMPPNFDIADDIRKIAVDVGKVSVRLDGVESWMSRITDKMEGDSALRERITALEKFESGHENVHAAMILAFAKERETFEKRAEKLENAAAAVNIKVNKWAGGLAVLTVIVAPILAALARSLFGV